MVGLNLDRMYRLSLEAKGIASDSAILNHLDILDARLLLDAK